MLTLLLCSGMYVSGDAYRRISHSPPAQVRGIAGDLVEEVKLIDNFTHPKTVRMGWSGLQPPSRGSAGLALACLAAPLRALPLQAAEATAHRPPPRPRRARQATATG